jgi:hypothetical protein
VDAATVPEAPAAVTLALEQYRIDRRVGDLRGVDGLDQAFLASAIDAVRQNDQRLAPLLFLHQLIRCQENRVVEVRAAVKTVAATIIPVAAAIVVVRGIEQRNGFFQLFARGGEFLQQLNLMIEVNQEGLVHVRAENVIEEGIARIALRAEDVSLAHTGVHQRPEGQRDVALAGEEGDGLRLAVFVEREVVLVQRLDDFAVLVPHRGVQRHGFHFRFDLAGGQGRLRLCL